MQLAFHLLKKKKKVLQYVHFLSQSRHSFFSQALTVACYLKYFLPRSLKIWEDIT